MLSLFTSPAFLKMILRQKHEVRLLLGWIFMAFLCLILCLPRVFSHGGEKEYSLLIVSFDGFRWNYLNRTHTPNFDNVIRNGVHASKGLMNVFTTATLTNHWSIVTGLYAESHGIVENEMFDPVINKTYIPLYKDKYARNDPRFYDTGVEPIWVANQLQKEHGRSGSIMWWGAENAVKWIRPTRHMPFDLDVDYRYRIDTMIDWFTDEHPINLGLLYFSEPDHSAHKYGPDSEEVTKMISYADELTGYLLEQLEEKDLLDDINIIITSDHGFAATSRDLLINLDDFIDPSWYHIVHYSPIASIIPHEGKEDLIFEKLEAASKSNHFTVYRKADIPNRWHYKNNARVTPIIAVADITYSFISQMPKANFTLAGTHGYDNKYEDMHPFFMALGPSFKKDYQVETFDLVDLYPLMCHLLHLRPAPNNGSMEIVSHLLQSGHENTTWTLATYMLCLITMASVGGIFTFGAWRNRRYLKRRFTNSRTSSGLSWVRQSLSTNSAAQVPLLSDNEDDEEEF